MCLDKTLLEVDVNLLSINYPRNHIRFKPTITVLISNVDSVGRNEIVIHNSIF